MPDQKSAETFQDFHFPKAGLHVVGPISRQPSRPDREQGMYVRTTRLGINVRSSEPAGGRARGGSRAGMSKYIDDPVYDGDQWVCHHLSIVSTTNPVDPMVQVSNSGRVVYLIAVSQGVVKYATPGATAWTTSVNNSGETPAVNFTGVMQSAANNQLLFIVDGINYVYFKPTTGSVEAWVLTAGSLPRDSDTNGARLICTWRGRTVLSGLVKDPQNIFLSKSSDPFNYDYSPATTTATDAVALNLSPLGLIGDVVNALIPYTDDILIVGGDHTIYMMRGDPADGGNIDLVSDITGIAFGECWCKDPYGNVYFFGSQPSIWKITGTTPPERISTPIDPLLQSIDTGNSIIRLVWDHRHQEVHVYITADDTQRDTIHYVWEYRTNSWFQDVFGNNDLNPLCCVAYDGNLPTDRVVLLGGWDGYVRAIDHNAVTDDGTAIDTSVLIGPILTQELDEMLLKDIQGVLASGSGDVSYEILAADTAEQAISATAAASGTFNAGRGNNQPIRVAGHAIYIKLLSSVRWAMESIRSRFAGRGKVRRRR